MPTAATPKTIARYFDPVLMAAVLLRSWFGADSLGRRSSDRSELGEPWQDRLRQAAGRRDLVIGPHPEHDEVDAELGETFHRRPELLGVRLQTGGHGLLLDRVVVRAEHVAVTAQHSEQMRDVVRLEGCEVHDLRVLCGEAERLLLTSAPDHDRGMRRAHGARAIQGLGEAVVR